MATPFLFFLSEAWRGSCQKFSSTSREAINLWRLRGEEKNTQAQRLPAADQWDLRPLFASEEDWELLFSAVESDLKSYDAYRGKLAKSAAVLATALECHLDVVRRIEKVYTYAHLKSDEDKSNQFYLGMHQRALSLLTRAS